MELDLIFKIAAVGIIVAVLNQILKKTDHDEQAMMLTVARAGYSADDADTGYRRAFRHDTLGFGLW